MLSCEDEKEEDNSRAVKVRIYRRDINVWAFGILVNGEQIFSASECEANNPNSSECVNFTDPYLSGFVFDYEFSANKGDEVGVLAVPLNNSWIASFAIWLYVDGDMKESESDLCDDGDCNAISLSYTIQ